MSTGTNAPFAMEFALWLILGIDVCCIIKIPNGKKYLQKTAAHIIMEKDGNSLSVYYENPTQQEIGVLYVNEPANN